MNATNERHERMIARAERRYRKLLRVLPVSFREQAEPELLAMFVVGYRRRAGHGLATRLAFWARMMADLAVTALVERGVKRPRLLGRGGSLRHALRRLAMTPARTATTSVTLGVGLGAAIIMMALVQGVLLRPLPFAQPDSLVRVLEVDEGGRTWWPSFANYADWREHGETLAGIAALEPPRTRPVLFGERAVRLPVGRVSPELFTVLGVDLARGSAPGAAGAGGEGERAVVSWSFWRDELGGRSLDELSLTVGPDRYLVAGVTPAGFRFLGAGGLWSSADVWLPLDRGSAYEGRQSHGYHVVGRIAPGLDLETTRRRMDALAGRLRADHGESTHAHTLQLTPLQEVVIGDAREPLTLLTYGAVLVLLVASFNLAGALLASGIARRAELAVRRALGATRGDLLRHLLLESLLLAVPGTLLGLAIAAAGLRLVLLARPAGVARVEDVALDGATVAVALLVALAATTVGGLLPAWTLSATRGADHQGGRGASAGRREGRAWRVFVAAQVAVSMVLLAAGGLLLKSFQEARQVDLGYQSASVLAVSVSLPESRYPAAEGRVSFFERAVAELQALPGVTAVGVSNILPQDTQALIGGASRPSDGETWMFTGLRAVNEGYFDALGIPRVAGGRWEANAGGVVVDESVAEVLFEGASPMGETIRMSMFEEPQRITGMVGPVREWNHPMHVLGTVYVDYRTRPDLLLDAFLIVRTAVPPTSLATSVRATLSNIDPVVPVAMDPLANLVAEQLSDRRVVLGIALAFALVTATLAAAGVYSVVAFVVRRRQREVGVRIALGARPGQVRRAMLRHGARPALVGLGLGMIASVPAGWLLRAQLFAVQPYDPTAIVGACAVLGVIALLAAYLPARRASALDPVVALRQQ